MHTSDAAATGLKSCVYMWRWHGDQPLSNGQFQIIVLIELLPEEWSDPDIQI